MVLFKHLIFTTISEFLFFFSLGELTVKHSKDFSEVCTSLLLQAERFTVTYC